jgi:hypothetical protein
MVIYLLLEVDPNHTEFVLCFQTQPCIMSFNQMRSSKIENSKYQVYIQNLNLSKWNVIVHSNMQKLVKTHVTVLSCAKLSLKSKSVI